MTPQKTPQKTQDKAREAIGPFLAAYFNRKR